MKKTNLILLVSIFILFATVLYTVLSSYYQSKLPIWKSFWLDGWQYRVPITIIDRSKEQPDNYTIKLELDTISLYKQGKIRNDCGDIRFTDSDGITLLDYYIGDCVTSDVKYIHYFINFSVKAYYSIGNECMWDMNTFTETQYEYNDISYTDDLINNCDDCDFYVRIFLNVINKTENVKVYLEVASDDGHMVWINGVTLGSEGCLCHCGGTAHRLWDITDYVVQGQNEIRIWCSEGWGDEYCGFKIKIKIKAEEYEIIKDGDYFFEKGPIMVGKNYTEVFVRVPNIGEGGKKVIYMYYGNLNATYNGTDKVFDKTYNIRDVFRVAGASCAITFDGKIKCWGTCVVGETGTGDCCGWYCHTTFRYVHEINSAKKIVVGGQHNYPIFYCALFDDGKIKCWGGCHQGGTGDGSWSDYWIGCVKPEPVYVVGIDNAVDVSAYRPKPGWEIHKVCALLANNSIACWGGYISTYETRCYWWGCYEYWKPIYISLPIIIEQPSERVVRLLDGLCGITESNKIICFDRLDLEYNKTYYLEGITADEIVTKIGNCFILKDGCVLCTDTYEKVCYDSKVRYISYYGKLLLDDNRIIFGENEYIYPEVGNIIVFDEFDCISAFLNEKGNIYLMGCGEYFGGGVIPYGVYANRPVKVPDHIYNFGANLYTKDGKLYAYKRMEKEPIIIFGNEINLSEFRVPKHVKVSLDLNLRKLSIFERVAPGEKKELKITTRDNYIVIENLNINSTIAIGIPNNSTIERLIINGKTFYRGQYGILDYVGFNQTKTIRIDEFKVYLDVPKDERFGRKVERIYICVFDNYYELEDVCPKLK